MWRWGMVIVPHKYIIQSIRGFLMRARMNGLSDDSCDFNRNIPVCLIGGGQLIRPKMHKQTFNETNVTNRARLFKVDLLIGLSDVLWVLIEGRSTFTIILSRYEFSSRWLASISIKFNTYVATLESIGIIYSTFES